MAPGVPILLRNSNKDAKAGVDFQVPKSVQILIVNQRVCHQLPGQILY